MSGKIVTEKPLIEVYQEQNEKNFNRLTSLVNELTKNMSKLTNESIKFHEVTTRMFDRLHNTEEEQRDISDRVRILENKSTTNETLKKTMSSMAKITLGSVVATVSFLVAYYFKSL